MAEIEQPKIYLITPAEFMPSEFASRLSGVLDAFDIACLRLGLGTKDEEFVIRAADTLREVAHARDIPLIIERHPQLAERLGLDGVHLMDARSVSTARKALGPDAIVGAFCGASRHEGMIAGEAGADYIAFGPAAAASSSDENHADPDLFAWWSETIELPVVAEGPFDSKCIEHISPFADFLSIGPEIWQSDMPVEALKALLRKLNQR